MKGGRHFVVPHLIVLHTVVPHLIVLHTGNKGCYNNWKYPKQCKHKSIPYQEQINLLWWSLIKFYSLLYMYNFIWITNES